MAYEFRPPTRELPFAELGRDRLWGRVTYPVGYAVVKRTDGTYEQAVIVDRSRPDATHIYTGGHVHVVDDDEAARLSAAGYGAFLTVV
jgi:hypothetical protein